MKGLYPGCQVPLILGGHCLLHLRADLSFHLVRAWRPRFLPGPFFFHRPFRGLGFRLFCLLGLAAGLYLHSFTSLRQEPHSLIRCRHVCLHEQLLLYYRYSSCHCFSFRLSYSCPLRCSQVRSRRIRLQRGPCYPSSPRYIRLVCPPSGIHSFHSWTRMVPGSVPPFS